MTANFHTPVSTSAPANASTLNTPLGELDDAITKASNGTTAITPKLTKVNVGTPTPLTIASGAITITQTRHTIDTEGAASTDNLDTISGGAVGDIIILGIANNSRSVIVRLVGNIYTKTVANVTLSETRQRIMLIFDGTYWCEV